MFEATRHDYGPKVFLGRSLRAQGRAEGEEALGILASSPATARHIAFELAQYFVADTPPPALVDRLAARFLATGGDIRQVLKTLFDSPEFWDSVGQKYKTPYEFLISAVRAAGMPLNNVRPLLGWLSRLGMPLYGCETPDGYKNTAAAWLSPDASDCSGSALPPRLPAARCRLQPTASGGRRRADPVSGGPPVDAAAARSDLRVDPGARDARGRRRRVRRQNAPR